MAVKQSKSKKATAGKTKSGGTKKAKGSRKTPQASTSALKYRQIISMVITVPTGLDTPTELAMVHDIAAIKNMLDAESDNKYDVRLERPIQQL
jgi:hypothetical protein